MIITWKTTGWSQQYRIFRDKIIVGILKKEGWKGEALGEYHGAMLRLAPRGFWKTDTSISDIENTKQLGSITYNHWKSTGRVTFLEKTFDWKYDSWKRNTWTISSNDGFAKYKITSFWKGQGEIEIEGIPPELVIIGLYIDVHFKTIASAAGSS